MKIQTVLVTGSNGQLGNEIRVLETQYPQFKFIFTDVAELDITDRQALESFFEANHPEIILNCAAYTAVDKAEDDVELCYKINEKAVALLGELADIHGIRIIHVSTDYVFDGKSYVPYTEEMTVAPATVYGKSKLAGEEALLKTCPNAVIIRTSWLYSSFGNNFVKTMMRLGSERDSLTVIFDQVGTPTYAADLAVAMLQVAGSAEITPGIYHFSNEGVCSWYDFAVAIMKHTGKACIVKPIESKDFPVKTPRPFYSVLNKQKIKMHYGVQIAHWEEALLRCLSVMS